MATLRDNPVQIPLSSLSHDSVPRGRASTSSRCGLCGSVSHFSFRSTSFERKALPVSVPRASGHRCTFEGADREVFTSPLAA